MIQSKNKTLVTLGGMLLGIVLLFVTMFAGHFPNYKEHYAWSVFLTRICIWLALAIVFLYAAKIEQQPFLPWRDKKHRWWKIVLFVLGIVILSVLVPAIINTILQHYGITSPAAQRDLIIHTLKANIPLLVFTCATAGVTEELLFRGYMLPRLVNLVKSPALAIIISALVFGIFHVGWGSWIQTIGPFWVGIVFGFFYWKFRSLKFLIIFHFCWDMLGMLVAK